MTNKLTYRPDRLLSNALNAEILAVLGQNWFNNYAANIATRLRHRGHYALADQLLSQVEQKLAVKV